MNFTNNALGIQDFEKIRNNHTFYVDKTDFIEEWWHRGSDVTLITRPRRFGKTLNMSMLNCFFSNQFAGKTDLFEGLSISTKKEIMALQGTFPVLFLSFASLKSNTFSGFKMQLLRLLEQQYRKQPEIEMDSYLKGVNKQLENGIAVEVNADILATLLANLSEKMHAHYGKKVIILLDEYDTPLQEAYLQGYWNEMISLVRPMFNATFKSNDSLYRAVLTGITRISKESIFSDFNNPDIVTTTSDKYATAFGFTEKEVFDALEAEDMSDQEENVKAWYDGFRFGKVEDIYNPWSITNFLNTKKLETYWANTSANSLAGQLIKQGSPEVKIIMEDLLKGIPLVTEIDEQIVFDQLNKRKNAIWSMLLASGYLRVDKHQTDAKGLNEYTLSLTNFEVKQMFKKMISEWFDESGDAYNDFIKALLQNDVDAMNTYMNRVSEYVFSNFDTGNRPSRRIEPERFYHGFVLGLMIDLEKSYQLTSNRESGFGRYDVMLAPRETDRPAYVIEFKVFDPRKDMSLSDAADRALQQIADKDYDAELLSRGIAKEHIRHYGFAFQGKEVFIKQE